MESLLQRLHTEILHNISAILDHTHPPSLVAFARAGRGCYAIASPLLHRTVKLTITDGQHLLDDSNRWEAVLSRDGGSSHVRRLIFLSSSRDQLQHNYLSLEPCERHGSDGLGLQSCWDLYYDDWDPHGGNASISAEQWQSLARLVRLLTGLADIFWACPIQIPLCILHVLHDSLHRCRLHHYSFQCRASKGDAIDAYDHAVATSPCLYAIGDLHEDENHRALSLVRRLGPRGLRRIYYWSRSDAIELQQAEQSISSPVPVEFIQLDGPNAPLCKRNMPFDLVEMLASGDFSALRALKLNVSVALERWPVSTSFPSLTTLILACKADEYFSPEYGEGAINLMRSLPRLKALRVGEWKRAVSIAPALGPNLHTLDLSTVCIAGGPALRDDHILQLAQLCPLLESLAIEVKRSRGDAAEVERYRALGRLPRLQHLRLSLDASPPGIMYADEAGANSIPLRGETAIEPWFNEQDCQLMRGGLRPHREGHVRDVLINSAVDAALARSIFEVIDRAKPEGPPDVLRLERLALRATDGRRFPEPGVMSPPWAPLEPFFAALDRRWVAERDVRDDARDVVHVRETHVDDRQYRLEGHRAAEAKRKHYWFGIWRRVWPVEHEGRDWWDDWQSYPLNWK